MDLSFIEGVARRSPHPTTYRIIVDKSTVPVKTAEKVAETIRRYRKSKVEFDVVSNPEFLREGICSRGPREARPHRDRRRKPASRDGDEGAV